MEHSEEGNTMKSSQHTVVTETLRRLEKIKQDMRYLQTCTALHFADAEEQRRVSFYAKSHPFETIKLALLATLEANKGLLIVELRKHGVEYDGD